MTFWKNREMTEEGIELLDNRQFLKQEKSNFLVGYHDGEDTSSLEFRKKSN